MLCRNSFDTGPIDANGLPVSHTMLSSIRLRTLSLTAATAAAQLCENPDPYQGPSAQGACSSIKSKDCKVLRSGPPRRIARALLRLGARLHPHMLFIVVSCHDEPPARRSRERT